MCIRDRYCSLNYIAILLFYTSLYHQKYQALIPPNNYNRSLIRQFCTSLTSNAKPSYILKSSRALTTRCTILNDQNMASFPCMPTSAKPIEHLRPQFPAKYKNHPFTASNMQTVRCVYLPLSKTRNIIRFQIFESETPQVPPNCSPKHQSNLTSMLP